MKTKTEIQKECDGEVYTLAEFDRLVDKGLIISYDGIGYFHDGEKETNISVWSNIEPEDVLGKYPYVCWYDK